MLAAYAGETIVAGAIGSRTGDVVGLSNLFAPAQKVLAVWSGCVAAVMDVFPGLPLVGYEAGEELAYAQAVGFTTLGPLRVWLRTQTE